LLVLVMSSVGMCGFSHVVKGPLNKLNIAAPPRAAPKQASSVDPLNPVVSAPAPWIHRPPPRSPSEYDLNLGRAIDALRHDYPKLFDEKPDLSIFSQNVELFDPSGKRLHGVSPYERVFDMLRLLRRTTMQHAEVTYRLVTQEDDIRVRWSAKMYMKDPVLGLTQLNIIDGVSVYELDSVGKIRSHRLESIIKTDQDHELPVSLGFLWPTGRMATPEMAMPFFRTLQLAASEAQAAEMLRPDHSSVRRARPPQASALSGETPMAKAARERDEDAQKAQRLAELRNPPKVQKKKGLFGFGGGPQECETSYDCDAPMVCCDLLIANVCCSGGMMIPSAPDPILQRQAIPIPVEKDSPFPPGMGGGGPPQYPGGY